MKAVAHVTVQAGQLMAGDRLADGRVVEAVVARYAKVEGHGGQPLVEVRFEGGQQAAFFTKTASVTVLADAEVLS